MWNGDKYRAILIDSLKKINNNAVIIFLDSQDKQNYVFEEYKEGISFIKTVSFIKNSEKKYSDNAIEKIHIFCKDIETHKLLASFSYREYMQNSKALYYSC